MDRRTKEALGAIARLRSGDDAVYEIFKTKKRSIWFHIIDTLIDVIPSVADKLAHDSVMYLLASEERGQIIRVEDGMIITLLDVPDWKANQKNEFQKVIIEGYVYKKFKRID